MFREIAMFGTTIKEMEKAYEEEMPFTKESYVQSILSDVQEMLLRGQNEEARQAINKAKYFLSKKK